MRVKMKASHSEPAAATKYALDTLTAITKPPRAGPTTDAMCIRLVFQVTALGNTSAGTSCGSSAVRAGRPTVIAQASRKSSAYIHDTGPSVSEKAASASDVTVIPSRLIIDNRLLS